MEDFGGFLPSFGNCSLKLIKCLYFEQRLGIPLNITGTPHVVQSLESLGSQGLKFVQGKSWESFTERAKTFFIYILIETMTFQIKGGVGGKQNCFCSF